MVIKLDLGIRRLEAISCQLQNAHKLKLIELVLYWLDKLLVKSHKLSTNPRRISHNLEESDSQLVPVAQLSELHHEAELFCLCRILECEALDDFHLKIFELQPCFI